MKVICIDQDAYPENESFDYDYNNIKEGVIYTVIEQKIFGKHLFYCVSDFPYLYFWSHCFATISDIDEKQLIKERQTEVTVINH